MVVIKGKKPHVLAVPLPFQGHVKPLMKLCRQIAKHGIKVTFVNIQSVHEKLVAAAKMSDDQDEELDNIVLTSIPDGRSPEDVDHENDSVKLLEVLRITMPGYLTELIERINSSNDDEKISCVITDITMGWILETAEKMGAEPVAFSPPSAAVVAIALHIPKLIEKGYLDSNGSMGAHNKRTQIKLELEKTRELPKFSLQVLRIQEGVQGGRSHIIEGNAEWSCRDLRSSGEFHNIKSYWEWTETCLASAETSYFHQDV